METNPKIARLASEAVAAIQPAREVTEKATAEGRKMTATERSIYDAAMAKGQDLAAQLKNARSDEAVMAEARALADQIGPLRGDHADRSGRGSLALTGDGVKHAAAGIARQMLNDNGFGQKALLPVGTVATAVPLAADPIPLGQLPVSLLDVLPLVQWAGSRFGYLQQGTRTINAAPVADGALKPTSVFGLTRIEKDLVTVAHLSEAVPKYWLEDTHALQQFLESELLYGLRIKLEDQVLNGTGVAPNMTGITLTSGRQIQAAVGTGGPGMFDTTRAAVTKVEAAGQVAGLFVLNVADWALCEMTRDAMGPYHLTAGPVERSTRRLWGTQVVTTTQLPAGRGTAAGHRRRRTEQQYAGNPDVVVGERRRRLLPQT